MSRHAHSPGGPDVSPGTVAIVLLTLALALIVAWGTGMFSPGGALATDPCHGTRVSGFQNGRVTNLCVQTTTPVP